jgi:hypothetical protein
MSGLLELHSDKRNSVDAFFTVHQFLKLFSVGS